MKKKIIYRFHNPTSDKELQKKYIEKMLIANGVERIFQEMQKTTKNESNEIEKVRS